MSTPRKIKETKWDYRGYRQSKGERIHLKFTCGHVVAIGLKYDEARLIAIRIYNWGKGKYDVSQICEEGRDTYRLTMSLPNTMLADEAHMIVGLVRTNVKAYQHEIKPYIFVNKKAGTDV